MLSLHHFWNQEWKKHLVVQTVEVELLAKDREIQPHEEHNIKLMHREEALRAQNARLWEELAAAQAIPRTSTISHSNQVQVAEANLVDMANLRL